MRSNNNNKLISRRGFVNDTMIGLTLLPLHSVFESKKANKQLNIVCIGAHPDDPETGCGGTLAKFSQQGHNVTVIYLTNGDAGILGKSYSEAASIRMEEARQVWLQEFYKPFLLPPSG